MCDELSSSSGATSSHHPSRAEVLSHLETAHKQTYLELQHEIIQDNEDNCHGDNNEDDNKAASCSNRKVRWHGNKILVMCD